MSGILRIENVSSINILKMKNNLKLKVMELAKVLFLFYAEKCFEDDNVLSATEVWFNGKTDMFI